MIDAANNLCPFSYVEIGPNAEPHACMELTEPTASAREALVLPVPGHDAGENDAVRSRAFQFPYETAYRIQLDLMTAVFQAVEHGQVGVFESPTGTGKTLSLLCSALSWLRMHRQRHIWGQRAASTVDSQDAEPEWVLAHEEAKQREAIEAYETELRERLQRARSTRTHVPATQKRARREKDTLSDDEFLVNDYHDAQDSFLSAEVRAMMHTYESQWSAPNIGDDETRPKIFYASRTHSQLVQLVHEVKRTPYGQGDEPVRCVSLGSRKQMCIHHDVRRIGALFGTEAMNERCLELMEGKKGKRCPYLPAQSDPVGRAEMDTYRDHALSHVQDMEDLVQLGKDMHMCPYFGTRHSARHAELVTLPYNLLLLRDAREALHLTLDGSVVIIDEAHNLIDTLLATYAAELTQAQIEQAVQQVEMYLRRFSMRLRGTNEEQVRILQVLLRALQGLCVELTESQTFSLPDFMSRLGGSVDQINLVRLERWLKDTRIARKMGGYADKVWLETHAAPAHRAVAMHALEAFLLALCNRAKNGRVLVTVDKMQGVRFKYLLLDPRDAFEPIVSSARAIILAGGTMEPMSDFEQLVPRDRFTTFSCGHIVPSSHVMGAVVPLGPKGQTLEFTHASWQQPVMLDELAVALGNYTNIVPHGMVVFFPSYATLDAALARWQHTHALERLSRRKKVLTEPKDAKDVDAVLQQYAATIADPSPSSPKGAMLLAVVGAKLSEGINFQDDLARCVVMIGLPFPHAKSRELAERLAFAGEDGRDMYVNMCMRAVNQSMGRAIRHRADYAAFLLLDRRYAREQIQSRLPGWIRTQVQVHDRFGSSIRAVAQFFQQMRYRAAT